MFFVAVVLVGLVSLGRLPIDLLPDVAYPRLVVYTEEPGSAPSEIERTITEPIEQAVASVAEVQRIESVTREGISLVTIRFAWGTEMNFAALNVRERLDNARAMLPATASMPVILRTDPRSEPVLSLSVSGGADPLALKEMADRVIKRRLEQLDGVAQAAVTGGLEREIQVDVDLKLLESHGLTIGEISSALASANVAGQGGTVLRGRYRYSLRTLGEFATPEEIGDVVVRSRAGVAGEGDPGGVAAPPAMILLRDVATITDGVKERTSITRFRVPDELADGAAGGSESVNPFATGTTAPPPSPGVSDVAAAVGILVFKTPDANTLRVSELVEETLVQLRAEYPALRMEIAMSQAGFIAEAIDNVLSALVLGGLLAFLVLFLFLHDPRYPVAIAIAIPISVIGTFALLDALGITLNIMTLGGLALGVGLLVDSSIVVLENIFRRHEMGEPMRVAAVLGTEEVFGAIAASTLTAVAVFGPVVYVEGVAGELFGALSLSVVFSLLISLLVSVTVLPAMAAGWKDAAVGGQGAVTGSGSAGGAQGRIRGWVTAPVRSLGRGLAAFDRGFEAFTRAYHWLLTLALAHRRRSVALSVGLLIVSLAGIGLLPREVLPEAEQGAFRARIQLDQGTPIRRTTEAAAQVEELLLNDPGVAAVFTRVGAAGALAGADAGTDGPHTAVLEVRLRPGAGTEAVVGRLRTGLASGASEAATGSSDSPPPGAGGGGVLPTEALTIETGGVTALGRLLGGAESDIAVRISADDLDAAIIYAGEVAAGMRSMGSLGNVRVGTELGQPEVRLEIDREVAASYGIEPRLIVDAIERSMRGTEATRFADFDQRIPVVVRLPEAQRTDLATLDEIRVEAIPVSLMARPVPGLGPAEIHRYDQARIVPVYADAAGVSLDIALASADAVIARTPPPPGIHVTLGGEGEEMRRSFTNLGFAIGLAVLLIYMILAAQFESFLHPFTILLSVPMALIGVVWALVLTGGGLNTMSLIGMVIMVGISVNNAIVMVDVMIRLRAEGRPVREAVVEAGHTRLRPIIMNTMANMLGLLPMAVGVGAGSDLRAPLAVTLIGGLAVSTLLTLIIIPVVFEMLERARDTIRGTAETALPARL
jgi:HAE1 family hydrophobic/amphiphilic exporter-1